MLRLSFLLAQALVAFAATADQWRGRSIYQVMTDRFARTDNSTTYACDTSQRVYCGGTWQGLINKLDYIQGMGFSAVWISPITHQTPIPTNSASGQSYHGYWQDDLYAVNSAFGSPGDLEALSSALHARGMYLMVDVVANHFSWPGPPSTINFTSYNPFSQASDFHSFCQVQDSDYTQNETAVEECWLGNNINQLTDVNTQSPRIKSAYQTWISQLVSNYSIDGLRIDTVRNVQPDFWAPFITASNVFAIGEVFNGDPAFTCPYQTILSNNSNTTTSPSPNAGILNYPLYFSAVSAFGSTTSNLSTIASTLNSIKTTCADTNLLGTFLENHDNPRFGNITSDPSLTRNAIALTMLSDGIPIVYQGQEQGYSGGNDPANREALWLSGYNLSNQWYSFIAQLNKLRSTAISNDDGYTRYKSWVLYNSTSTLVLRKGSDGKAVISVFTNTGASGGSYSFSVVNTGYAPGTQVVDVLGGCRQVSTVGQDGSLDVEVVGGMVRVFYLASLVMGNGSAGGNGSGMCEDKGIHDPRPWHGVAWHGDS